MDIPLGEWLPDQPSLNNPGVLRAENVLPTATGYKPFPASTQFAPQIDARCRGAIAAKDYLGSINTFVGDINKLYKKSGAAWNDVSSSPSPYNLTAEDYWEFTQYNNIIYATTIVYSLQKYNLGSSIGGGSTNFVSLLLGHGSKHIAVVRDFLVLAYTNNSADGIVTNRVWWSAKGNPDSWPTPGSAAANQVQSDYQHLEASGGAINGIIGGEYGIIFQDNAIWRMTYEGPPTFFRFDKISDVGSIFPRSQIAADKIVFFLSKKGFKATDGFNVFDIGEEKINKQFFSEMTKLVEYKYKVSTAVSYSENCVFWSYPISSTDNKIYCYNYLIKKWSYINISNDLIFSSFSGNSTGSTAETDRNIFAYFQADRRLYIPDGSIKINGIIETAEVQPTENRKTRLKKLKVHSYGGTVTTDIGIRETTQAAVTYPSNLLALPSKANGETDVRANSKYYRFRINTSGDFGEINKVNLTEFSPGSTR